MTQGSTPRDLFTSFASDLAAQGVSGNAIISAARDAGFGIRRQDAYGIIRELRQAAPEPQPLPFVGPQAAVELNEPIFRWGQQAQQSDQWGAFEGPSATMFQQMGPDSNEWLDYVVLPEDEDYIGFRMVIADDEYVSQDGRNTGYRTSQSFDASISLADAARRLGVEQGDIARVIYDRP